MAYAHELLECKTLLELAEVWSDAPPELDQIEAKVSKRREAKTAFRLVQAAYQTRALELGNALRMKKKKVIEEGVNEVTDF